jgi:hypothetical protein
MSRPSYFLISVSNKQNLDLCIRYSLAGFTNSINGLWTYSELNEADYVSFLYGARAHNLYIVDKKEAITNAEELPPWPKVTFKMSGKTYHFPFRVTLKPVRKLNEPLVRNEFSYVAENLLLRGGYRKTHFQADQTTLQNVSQMGETYKEKTEKLNIKYDTFTPKFTTSREETKTPETFFFQEIILQALIRQHLSKPENMANFLNTISIDELDSKNIEVLGEKAIPEGHIDILIKEAIPLGISKKIIIEVKTGKATEKDFEQLKNYVNEVGDECIRGVLIAADFSKRAQKDYKEIIAPVSYHLEDFNIPLSFEELKSKLVLFEFS